MGGPEIVTIDDINYARINFYYIRVYPLSPKKIIVIAIDTIIDV